MALLSAFLHDEVLLDEQPSETEIQSKLLELGTYGEAILASIRGSEKSAFEDSLRHANAIKGANVLAQDQTVLHEQLETNAREFTAQL